MAEISSVLGTLDLLTSALQSLPGVLPQLSTIGGLSERVRGLHGLLSEINGAPPPAVARTAAPSVLGCEGLGYSTPDGQRKLARALSLTVREGSSVLIVGESGIGKSSLLRCLAGLWDADEGALFGPPPPPPASGGGGARGGGAIMFLPQRPYMCVGSLRAQVVYPLPDEGGEGGARDLRIRSILEQVCLAQPLAQFGLDGVQVWEDVLIVGEQQRVCFARLLFHRPQFAIMDEASSALDLGLEATCMQHVVAAGITLLAVAHRPSLRHYFQQLLRMRPDGRHELLPMADAGGGGADFDAR